MHFNARKICAASIRLTLALLFFANGTAVAAPASAGRWQIHQASGGVYAFEQAPSGHARLIVTFRIKNQCHNSAVSEVLTNVPPFKKRYAVQVMTRLTVNHHQYTQPGGAFAQKGQSQAMIITLAKSIHPHDRFMSDIRKGETLSFLIYQKNPSQATPDSFPLKGSALAMEMAHKACKVLAQN